MPPIFGGKSLVTSSPVTGATWARPSPAPTSATVGTVSVGVAREAAAQQHERHRRQHAPTPANAPW